MPDLRLYDAPATPQQAEFLAQAKRHKNITTPGMPSEWAFTGTGNLVTRVDGRPVQVGRSYSDGTKKPTEQGWKYELLHASPYIGAAFGMGALGGIGGAAPGAVAPAAASSVGPGVYAPAVTAAATGAPAVTAAATTAPVVAGAAAPSLGRLAIGYGAQLGGDLLGSYLQSRSAGKASDAQMAYYREALAYEKERDAYDRQLESSRYADLRARLQPWVTSGQSASDRMAELLGLGRG